MPSIAAIFIFFTCFYLCHSFVGRSLSLSALRSAQFSVSFYVHHDTNGTPGHLITFVFIRLNLLEGQVEYREGTETILKSASYHCVVCSNQAKAL
jgi:hypothetical protein